MKQFVIVLLLFMESSIIFAQRKNNPDSLFTILVLGITTRKLQIRAEVANKFGFKYKVAPWRIIDGIETSPNSDSMQRENDRTYKLIDKKYGSA